MSAGREVVTNKTPREDTWFPVPLTVARHLTASFDGPEVLVAYMILCHSRYPERKDKDHRWHTTAGANLMWKATGISRRRCEEAVKTLRQVTIEGTPVVTKTDIRRGLFDVYRLTEMEGESAYLPTLLVDKVNPDTILKRLCSADLAHSTVRRDALLALLTLYAVVDYAKAIGAPQEQFLWQQWEFEGWRGVNEEFELGLVDTGPKADLWLVAAPPAGTWSFRPSVAETMFLAAPDAGQRLVDAVGILSMVGAIKKVAVAQFGDTPYPLWYFNEGVRDQLSRKFGIRTNLADDFQGMAGVSGADANNMLIREAVDLGADIGEGTGLFYCMTAPNAPEPEVRTLVIPRLYAPTPRNCKGLEYTAETTTNIGHLITRYRQEFRRSA